MYWSYLKSQQKFLIGFSYSSCTYRVTAFKGGVVNTLPLGKNVVVVLVADHLVFHKTLLCVSSNEIKDTKWPVLSAQWLAQWLVFTKMLSCSVFTSQTPRRIDCLCRIHEMWHCYRRKGTSVRSHRGSLCFADGTLCLQSTNCCRQACGPVQSASLGRPWWHHLWSQTDCQKPQSWALMVGYPTICLNPVWRSVHSSLLFGCQGRPSLIRRSGTRFSKHWNRVPLLLIHHGLPWHPNNNQEWTLLHTAVPEWWSGLFHRIAPIAQAIPYKRYNKTLGHMRKSRHSCPEFWVCLALFGVHRLYHLRLRWHMPTKGPWAHHDSTCCVRCGYGRVENSRVDRRSDLNQTGCWWNPHLQVIECRRLNVPWYAGDFQTVAGSPSFTNIHKHTVNADKPRRQAVCDFPM